MLILSKFSKHQRSVLKLSKFVRLKINLIICLTNNEFSVHGNSESDLFF